MKNYTIIFLTCFFLFPALGAGQNLMGGYIYAKRVPPSTSINYSVTAELYVKGPVTNNSYIHIDWGDQSPLDSLLYTGPANTSGVIKKVVSGIHTYQPGQYHISVKESFYISNVLNIPNSGTQKLQLRYDLYADPRANSSPVCLFPLVDSSFFCTINANLGIYDADGDSLSFSVTTTPNVTNYIIPSATVQSDGTMTVSSIFSSYNAMSLQVNEWRKTTVNGPNAVIGTSYLELMFNMCTSNPVNLPRWKNEFHDHIYPNPVANELTCDFSGLEITELSFTNSLGQEVLMRKNPPAKEKIGLEFLSSGIYYLKANSSSGGKIYKIIKE